MKRAMWWVSCLCLAISPAGAGLITPGLVTEPVAAHEAGNLVVVPLFAPSTSQGGWDRAELLELARRAVAARIPVGSTEAGVDAIVMFTDRGRPLLPDLDRPATTFGAATNQLTFTFDSPADPWTQDELAILEDYLADFYPVVASIYGPPAFDITVNVSRGTRAFYVPATNDIVIPSVPTTSLCHEVVHAFHDDAIVLSIYEEGLARAVEILAYSALDEWVHFNEHHSQRMYDVYYDLLNQPDAGVLGDYGWTSGFRAMLRYQLGGYAWSKPWLEDSDFFARFNEAYYAARLLDPAIGQEAADLLAIARKIQPEVEGQSFDSWSQSQYALRIDAPPGHRIHHTLVHDDAPTSCGTRADVFHREEGSGTETYRSYVPVEWQLLDHAGGLLDAGITSSEQYGHAEIYASVPASYIGRMTFVTTALDPWGTPITDVSRRPNQLVHGIFGVVRDSLDGEITAVHLPTGAQATAALTNGAFELPTMGPLAGAFELTVRYPGGRTQLRRITKDASDYYVGFGPLGSVGIEPSGAWAYAAAIVPNPVTTHAALVVTVPSAGPLEVDVFDPAGRRVAATARFWLPAGTHRVALAPAAGRWNSGIHLYRVRAASAVHLGRFVVLR